MPTPRTKTTFYQPKAQHCNCYPEIQPPSLCLHVSLAWTCICPYAYPLPRDYWRGRAPAAAPHPIPDTVRVDPTIPWQDVQTLGAGDRQDAPKTAHHRWTNNDHTTQNNLVLLSWTVDTSQHPPTPDSAYTWSSELPPSDRNAVRSKTQTVPSCTGRTISPTTERHLRPAGPQNATVDHERVPILYTAIKGRTQMGHFANTRYTNLFPAPSSAPQWSPTTVRTPCYTAPVWVFFVHRRHREITL